MAKSKVLTEKQVLKQIGTRKLNPDLIDAALSVLRGLYLGIAYPIELAQGARDGKPLPLGSLLLNPRLSEKLSDQLGPITMPGLQKMIEDASVASNRVAEVTNKIFEIHNRITEQARPVPVGEGPALKDIVPEATKLPKIPPPFTGKYLDAASQFVFIDSLAENNRRMARNEEIQEVGYDLPANADAFKTAETMMRLIGHSALAANMMAPGKTYEAILNSPEYRRKQTEYDAAILADAKALRNDPVAKKYAEDYPLGADALMAMFTGLPVTAAFIPARELATLALVVANNPAVRDEAFKVSTLQPDGNFNKLMKTSNAVVTKAILDGGFAKARLIPDIAAAAVTTSPFFWESAGLKYPGQNIVWDAVRGAGEGLQSIRKTTQNQLLKRMIDAFTDRDVLRYEQFQNTMLKDIRSKYGPDFADAAALEFGARESQLLTNAKAKENQALALREYVYSLVKSHFTGLTNDEVSAAILMKQAIDPADVLNAPAAVKEAMKSPFVLDAVNYMDSALEDILKFDPGIVRKSHYFPAWETRARNATELSAAYIRRGYKEAREVVSHVIPDFTNPRATLDNLVDRLAAPFYEPVIAGNVKTAESAAGIFMQILEDKIKDPELALKHVTRVMGETPVQKASDLSRMISKVLHTEQLTSAFPRWFSGNAMDDATRGLMGIYDSAKAGKWPTWRSLRQAYSTASPPELFDQTFVSGILDDVLSPSQGIVQSMDSINKTIFGAAARMQNFALDNMYKFFIAAGHPEAKAIEMTKEYMLARRVNSAFTRNAATRFLATYANFYTQAAKFQLKEMGRSPEIFKAGAALLNDLRQQNEQLPPYLREGVKIGDRLVQLPKKSSIYPLLRAYADMAYGLIPDSDTQKREDWKNLSNIKDPYLKMQILDKNPGLRDFGTIGIGKAIGDTLQGIQDYHAIPLGHGVTVTRRVFDIGDKVTQSWLPFGREMSMMSRIFGLPHLDVEGNLDAMLKGYRSESFDTDSAIELMLLGHRGQMKDFANVQEALDFARKKSRSKIIDQLVMGRTFGLGTQMDPVLVQYQNDLSDLLNIKKTIAAPKDEVARIQKEYGVTEDEAQLVWKFGYDTNLDFMKQVPKEKQLTLQELPRLQEYQHIMSQKWEGLQALNIKDRLDLSKRIPQDNIKQLRETDNIAQAFISSFPDSETGRAMFAWMKLTPQEKVNYLRSSPFDQAIIREYAPREWELYKAYVGGNGLIPLPQYIERENAGVRTKDLFDAIHQTAIRNASGVAQPVLDLIANPLTKEDIGKALNTIKEKGLILWDKLKEELNRPLIPEAAAAELLYGDEAYRKRFDDPKDPASRSIKAQGDAIMDEWFHMPATQKASPSPKEMAERQAMWNDRVFKAADPDVQKYISTFYNEAWRGMGGAGADRRYGDQDITGVMVSFSSSDQFTGWLDDAYRMLGDRGATEQSFKSLLSNAQQTYQGLTIQQYLERNGKSRSLVRLLQKRAQGYTPGLGYETRPNYDLDQRGALAQMNRYIDLAYRRPDEKNNIQKYHARLLEAIKPSNLPDPVYQEFIDKLRERGMSEAANAINLNRQGLNVNLPLDPYTKDKIRALQDQLPAIENDPALVMDRLQQDPELLSVIRDYDKRLYRSLENKIWGDLDSSWKTYLRTSGYAPEVLDYYRRIAPQSYSRNYYRDTNLRAASDSLGIDIPNPTAEVSVRGADGQEQRIPSIFAPNVLAPSNVPKGAFSTLPGALLYVQQRSRQEASILQAAKDQGAKLTKGESDFLEMDRTTRVFASFPGAIAQAFREGELGPDDVIKQLSGVNQFASAIGAITPEQSERFLSFLSDASTVFGATQFGANLGKFLDDTFNIPRIPFKSRIEDFLLFGRPESTLSITDPRNRLAGPVLPAISYGSSIPRFENVGINNIPDTSEAGPRQPKQAPPPEVSQTDQALEAGKAASDIGGAAGAAKGSPTAGIIFATISAGLTIATILRSRRQRKRLREEARKQAAEQQRQLELARAEAASLKLQAEQRQLANIRLQRFEQEAVGRERSFNERVRLVLESGAPIASLSQQPQEFIQTFVDRFEPQVLQFVRRPTFSSNVGLIQEIEGMLPKARY